jgi:hypothetical protein
MPTPVLEAPKPTKPDDPPTEGGEDEGSKSSAAAEFTSSADVLFDPSGRTLP